MTGIQILAHMAQKLIPNLQFVYEQYQNRCPYDSPYALSFGPTSCDLCVRGHKWMPRRPSICTRILRLMCEGYQDLCPYGPLGVPHSVRGVSKSKPIRPTSWCKILQLMREGYQNLCPQSPQCGLSFGPTSYDLCVRDDDIYA